MKTIIICVLLVAVVGLLATFVVPMFWKPKE